MNRGQDRVLLRRLGEQLRRRRLLLGRSQSQVAERVGVSQSSVSRMERGTAGGAPFRTWTAVADVLGLSIAFGSSIDLDPPGTQAMAGSMVDRRLAGLELVARLAEAGHWAARSRVVEDSSGTLRSVNLTLRRFAPPQAVVVRIWDTAVDVESLVDDLDEELEAARRSTDVDEISGLILFARRRRIDARSPSGFQRRTRAFKPQARAGSGCFGIRGRLGSRDRRPSGSIGQPRGSS